MTHDPDPSHPIPKVDALIALGAGAEQPGDDLKEGALRTALFEEIPVRGRFHQGEWWLSIVDIITGLSISSQPSRYWTELRDKLIEVEGFSKLFGKIEKLKMPSDDGKMRRTEAVSFQTLLRILQSVPSPKVEPLKQWLAQVGFERLQELDDPSEALERLINIYLNQGRTPDWIRERIDGIMTRRELTDEWKARGIEKDRHYSILTRMLQKRSIGLGPSEHRKHKGLKRGHSLRDHSTETELLLTRLGERSTIEIARAHDAQGYEQNRDAVEAGGNIAKTARLKLEELIGTPIASKQNFLGKPTEGALPSPPSARL